MERGFQELLSIRQFANMLMGQLPLAVRITPLRCKQQKWLIGQVSRVVAKSEFIQQTYSRSTFCAPALKDKNQLKRAHYFAD